MNKLMMRAIMLTTTHKDRRRQRKHTHTQY